MKGQLMKVMGVVAVLTGWTAFAHAGTSTITFDSHARLPEATAFECKMSKGFDDGLGNPNSIQFVQYNSTFLEFGTLVEAGPAGNGYGWWKSIEADFFVCDLRPVGGVGVPTVTFTYQNLLDQNAIAGAPYNLRHGLDYKGVMTAVAMKKNPVAGGQDIQAALFGKKIFKDISQITVSPTVLITNQAWARLYFGLAFYPASGPVDPANAEVFTGLDHHGDYTGKITATVTW